MVQFIENYSIYPHVVGSSVGLEPRWSIIAVLVGGAAFGVLGMIFFIPVMAVVYILLKESVNARIERKMAAARQAQTAEEDAALQVLEDEEPADGNG